MSKLDPSCEILKKVNFIQILIFLFLIGFGIFIATLSSSPFLQWGDLIKKVERNPLASQQEVIRDLIVEVQSISSAFTQMHLTSGKLDFIKEALPLLTQVNSLSGDLLSSVQEQKSINLPQTTTMNGLLAQVKGLLTQKWSATPLAANQISQAKAQSQQITSLLESILKNQRRALQSLIPGLKAQRTGTY